MSESTSNKSITFEFNALLFVFLALVGVVLFALSDRAKGLSFEGVIMVSAIDAVRYTLMMLIGSFFIKEFWRRLISNRGCRRIGSQPRSCGLCSATGARR